MQQQNTRNSYKNKVNTVPFHGQFFFTFYSPQRSKFDFNPLFYERWKSATQIRKRPREKRFLKNPEPWTCLPEKTLRCWYLWCSHADPFAHWLTRPEHIFVRYISIPINNPLITHADGVSCWLLYRLYNLSSFVWHIYNGLAEQGNTHCPENCHLKNSCRC